MAEGLSTTIELGTPPVVHLDGDVDRTATDALDRTTDEVIDMGPATVILDFTRAGYINSSGIALIVGLLGRARAAGIAVHARGLSDHYRHVFEITRLDTFITIDDKPDA